MDSVDEELMHLKETFTICGRDTCRVRRLVKGGRKGSEWKKEEIREVIQRNKEIYKSILQNSQKISTRNIGEQLILSK